MTAARTASRIPASPIRTLLATLLAKGLASVDAGRALARQMRRNGPYLLVGRRRYDLRRYERVMAVGAGKATAAMAQALERRLGRRLSAGMVVVKYGHRVPTRTIAVVEAGHPIPDRAGQRAAKRVHSLVAGLSRRDLLIVLLSGGASSLLPAPSTGLSLRDMQITTDRLLRSGATIEQVNTVRKHLSSITGGRLAESTQATIMTLLLSDVLGNDLSAVASGPTAPDPATFRQAVAILKRRRVWSAVPASVRRHLLKGQRGLVPETPKPGSAVFRRVSHHLLGSNAEAVDAVARAARAARLETVVLPRAVTGEASRAGRRFGAMAKTLRRQGKGRRRPFCLVAGGETTVTVTGRGGMGGRAQEFACAAALEIAGLSDVWVAAVGTDGTDGPTDVAGAVVSGVTVRLAERRGIDLEAALAAHNTYPALKQLRCHIHTGPTGTNVNDLYLLFLL